MTHLEHLAALRNLLTQNEPDAVPACLREKAAEGCKGPTVIWASHLSGRAEGLKMPHLFSTDKITLFTRIDRQEGDF